MCFVRHGVSEEIKPGSVTSCRLGFRLNMLAKLQRNQRCLPDFWISVNAARGDMVAKKRGCGSLAVNYKLDIFAW